MLAKRKGQVWIETVLYTLIGLALIGLALAIITPKINETKDRLLVERTIDSLGILDGKINEVAEKVPGNKREIKEFNINKGKMIINGSGDEIKFIFKDLTKPYSEPGIKINKGRVEILSEEKTVYLTLKYDEINITYNGGDELKEFSASSTPYKFTVENLGMPPTADKNVINIEEISGR